MADAKRGSPLRSVVSDARVSIVARGAWGACLALGAVHTIAFLWVALSRVRYPYDLEWMEGGQLLHSYEVLQGRFPYRAPSADFIAYPYQPLYAALVALVGAVFGLSLPVGRVVSIVSIVACAIVVGRAVWHETGSRSYAMLGGATVFALYRVTGFWFDLARVDSLFLALLVGGLAAARYIATPWKAAAASAVLLILAYKTKQLALPFFVLVPAVLYGKSRRAALAFVPLTIVPLMLDHAISNFVSDGWFSFYVQDVPRGQPFVVKQLAELAFTIVSDVPFLTILALTASDTALRSGDWRKRIAQIWPAALVIGFVTTALAWSRPGGAANNLMTTYVLAIVPAFVALRAVEKRGPPLPRALTAIALAAQLLWLGYDPTPRIPNADDYAIGQAVVGVLRAAPGPVLIAEHPWLAVLAGKQPSFQSNAYWELSFQNRSELIPEDLRQRLRENYYTIAIEPYDPRTVVDSSKWWPPEYFRYYRCSGTLPAAAQGLRSFAGRDFPPPLVVCTYDVRDEGLK